MAVFWLGLALFTIGLAVLLYTRWGQYRPLRKCMGLSLLAHMLMACYAATIQIVAPTPPLSPLPPIFQVSLDEELSDETAGTVAGATTGEASWERFSDEAPAVEGRVPLPKSASSASPLLRRGLDVEPARIAALSEPKQLPSEEIGLATIKPMKGAAPGPAAEAIEPPQPRSAGGEAKLPLIGNAALPRSRDEQPPGKPPRPATADLPEALLEQVAALPRISENEELQPVGVSGLAQNAIHPRPLSSLGGSGGSATEVALELGGGSAISGGNRGAGLLSGPVWRDATYPAGLPKAYRLRMSPDKLGTTLRRGGSTETEAAVKAALKWLADNQSGDGRWDPRVHGAGNETRVLGRDRQNAGSRADTAVTGLALLSFLGAGHTHLEGPYREDVRRGLEYLMRVQGSDGCLAGHAAPFEFMYCHAMAACALSEAYGMTRDNRLRRPVERAIDYTISAQDSLGGGWRYKPGNPGDTSQIGWQLLALKSAELAGIPITEQTRQGIIRFLRSVSSGQYGGRAAYRPGEQPTRTMTAEALVCWQFLGLPPNHPAAHEAGNYLLEELPGQGVYNLYYLYYATLAMYQLGGVSWERWNEAMREAVLARQIKTGPLAGSWDTSDLWGGYGGRVYTTALAALTLEVYYRFLPLYAEVGPEPAERSAALPKQDR